MATISATLLPMWRSPTASSYGSRTPSHALRVQDSWDDDGTAYALGSAHSPTRVVQCLNFLSQIERVQVREVRSGKRFRDPVFQLDVYLCDEDGCEATNATADRPTYQIERSLAEFEQLRDGIAFWTTRDTAECSFCSGFLTRRAAWEQHWPRRLLRRFFGLSKLSSATPLEQMLCDVLALSQSQLSFREPCAALEQVPALVTSFLVRHELSMDE